MPSSPATQADPRSAPAAYGSPQPLSPGYSGYPGRAGGFEPRQPPPIGVDAGFARNAAAGTGAGTGRVMQIPSPDGPADARIRAYNDYTSIPEKPPSGMPKAGVDFFEGSDK